MEQKILERGVQADKVMLKPFELDGINVITCLNATMDGNFGNILLGPLNRLTCLFAEVYK